MYRPSPTPSVSFGPEKVGPMSHSRKLFQRLTTATVDLRQAYFDTILISY